MPVISGLEVAPSISLKLQDFTKIEMKEDFDFNPATWKSSFH